MKKPEVYFKFYVELLQHNIKLITTPSEYSQMHVFPNVYNLVKEDTPKMVVYPLHETINIEDVKKQFTRFMVKDYVKSVKGTEFPKYVDQTITQANFNTWMIIEAGDGSVSGLSEGQNYEAFFRALHFAFM